MSVILLADDDASIRTVLTQALTRAGYAVRATDSCTQLMGWLEAGEGDLLLCDVLMPDGNAFDFLSDLRTKRPHLPFLIMSAQNTFMTAIRASEIGAYEYLPKPFDLDDMLRLIARALSEVKPSAVRVASETAQESLPLIGRSPAMQEVYRVLARLMQTDLTVMITGESGTGKELVARALHDFGRRKNGQFVAVNMAAIPRDLIEAELFGHEKGAFTGAVGRGVGRFEQAEGGTLFLDEIGDMPMEAQTRLLRVLQQGEYSSVGGRALKKTDVRIIAATHKDLPSLIAQGLFREDLYYRLNVVPVRLPPLRERKQDIADLARHFLKICQAEGMAQKHFEADALAALQRHSWPGNVRELENLLRRLVVLAASDRIACESVEAELKLAHMPHEEGAPADFHAAVEAVAEASLLDIAHHGTLYERLLADMERPLLLAVLRHCRGNQLKAAEILGLNRNTLRKKINDLSIRSEI